MIQLQYMSSWAPTFVSAMDSELSARDNKPPFISFQLATVNKEGFPHNRTLVSRGFLFDDKTSNVLTFCTDKRTDKYKELLENDRFEAVFYFEKIRKQFRLRGRARIIDDVHTPQLDLTTIQPKHIIASNINSRSDDEGNLEISVSTSHASNKNEQQNGEPLSPQATPLPYPIISPRHLSRIHKEGGLVSASFANLYEVSSVEFEEPTREEWDSEIQRIWGTLSKGLKLGFRGPLPGENMDEKNQNLIDKINRGVDGKKEESGLKNFAVVGMFIDHVDYYDQEKGRRYIYRKDKSHHWDEQEVCP
ncbi:hypothetical protein METBIDRAFT_218903 [Metschnikowia bicuspidata var. bicuspidata NRRL YB-4993]|uniref:Pyridoxamine 5'-phosphate oxidase Alr4036 family FMN-binding domain-containing protein n=1 Tax=Metschnikowia bicuspidata var. bicuspidata NRRL YB-4993 TaxID=869754 RepID=A0A1A0H6I3_9ASCO|nr:hypothetical protein METBIDRAFT_218903 [Metschnikowia bicuspidata var. bicuspidata NRRL YB-4993]OBA19694.1 hypothetical protein METBIDRAFT_218903 [Metschnikowia bicuspidata var. bicuspidata NRRL YB-4993]